MAVIKKIFMYYVFGYFFAQEIERDKKMRYKKQKKINFLPHNLSFSLHTQYLAFLIPIELSYHDTLEQL